MRKWIIVLILLVAAGAGYFAFRGGEAATPTATGGGKGKGFGRAPMTVDVVPVTRQSLQEYVQVVGSLIGAATVEVVPQAAGRLQTITVRMGDPVSRGQRIATVDDREIREQLRQAEGAHEVAQATIRQREADLAFAKTNLDRSNSLFQRDLLPQQTLDDAEARTQAAQAQLDLARAQLSQAASRLEELRIQLANTNILSPVDGFVGRRYVDPGAFVSTNQPVAQVVDISLVRLVVNLVERDLRRVSVGASGAVDVDAFPGESFEGRIARISPVLDPATRTAEMEIEIPNPTKRLKPGMYARVRLMTADRTDALVAPKSAIVDVAGRRGVYLVESGQAVFRPVEVGIEDGDRIEITGGLTEGEAVVFIGASSIRDGDQVLLPGQGGGAKGGAGKQAAKGGGAGGGARESSGAKGGQAQGQAAKGAQAQ